MPVRWRCPKCKKIGTTPLDQPVAWCLKCFIKLERRDTSPPRKGQPPTAQASLFDEVN
jgi:hypothetical protein